MPSNWTPAEDTQLQTLLAAGHTREAIAKQTGRSYYAVTNRVRALRAKGVDASAPPKPEPTPAEKVGAKRDFDLPVPEFGYLPIDHLDALQWIHVGLVGDTHLACKECRLDALHAQYDLFEREGIKTVLHAGNIVDGYIPRINGASVLCSGVDDQAQYVIDHYPARKSITTHFITGDDHEGWWQKEGFNFGAYLAMLAKEQGRTDLNYIGHIEADVEIKCRGTSRSTIIKVQHPGGGSAYSRSYTGQKQVEAFQGGEKPDVLVQGHYHVSNYMNDRNVHVISLPGFQDQTVFARKKRLRMEIGGALLSFKVSETGALTRCRVEFNIFFDRGYYKPYLRSDAKILKGHLVLDA